MPQRTGGSCGEGTELSRGPQPPPRPCHTVPALRTCWKPPGSLFPVTSDPCLTSGLVLCCIPSSLPIHPGHLGVQACPVSMPALASLLVPPADPLSPGWPLSSDNAQWLPGVPEGDTPSPGSQGWVLLTLCSTFPFQGPLTCPALSS